MQGRTEKSDGTINVLRRRLLAAVAGIMASSSVHATLPVIDASELFESWDILIVGAGLAGLTAAVRASELGAKRILVVEKEPFIGGASLLSEGAFAFSDTKEQRRAGVSDSDDAFRQYLFEIGRGKNDPALVDSFFRHQHTAIEWLNAKGLSPEFFTAHGVPGIPRAHTYRITKVLEKLRSDALSNGVRIVVGTKAENLIIKGGRISGAVLLRQGKQYEVRAGAVLLATGGFLRNKTMVIRSRPILEQAIRICAPGSDGDGLRMGIDAGAAVRDLEWLQASFGFCNNPTSLGDFTHVGYAGAIAVDAKGLRFIDESSPYTETSDKVLETGGNTAWFVFDAAVRRAARAARPVDDRLLAEAVRADGTRIYWEGETPAEAARLAGLPPDALSWTVSRYNSFVRSGRDLDFGRTSLASGYGSPVLLLEPPFCVMPASAGLMGSYCGLWTDPDCRVLRSDKTAVSGLFAAGEVTGGFHGAGFAAGTGLSKALIFGYAAGQIMAGDWL